MVMSEAESRNLDKQIERLLSGDSRVIKSGSIEDRPVRLKREPKRKGLQFTGFTIGGKRVYDSEE